MEIRERYNELCRLCASYDAVKMDIFGLEGKNRQLVDKIQTCLPFKVSCFIISSNIIDLIRFLACVSRRKRHKNFDNSFP